MRKTIPEIQIGQVIPFRQNVPTGMTGQREQQRDDDNDETVHHKTLLLILNHKDAD